MKNPKLLNLQSDIERLNAVNEKLKKERKELGVTEYSLSRLDFDNDFNISLTEKFYHFLIVIVPILTSVAILFF